MGAFSYSYYLAKIVGKYIIDSCTVKTAIEVQRLCVPTSKNGTCVGFLHFSPPCLFACAATNWAI